MRAFRPLIFFLTASFIVSSSAFQQAVEAQKDIRNITSRYGFEVYRKPYINFNYWYGKAHQGTQPAFVVSFAIQNDYLTFVRENDVYVSEYQVTVSVRREEEESSEFGKSWRLTTRLKNFDDTNAHDQYQYYSFDLEPYTESGVAELLPGRYDVVFEFSDHRSSRVYTAMRRFEIIADGPAETIVFLKTEAPADSGTIALCSARTILDFNNPYRAFCRLLVDSAGQYYSNYRLFRKINEDRKLVHQQYDTLSSEQGVLGLYYNLPYEKMEEGDYTLRMVGEGPDEKEQVVERDFSVVWFEKPIYLYKVDLAVRPMKYLLSADELERVKELDLEQLSEWFDAYWKERDKNPETAYNELKHEYYRRVTHTLRHYSTRFKEGWETDRGMVYILYGEPQRKDEQRYLTDKPPFEVWYYPERETSFVFVDENRNGEYILQKEKGINP